jgi:hypothetical protein
MYGPPISDAKPLRYYDMGSHVGVLFGELACGGSVEYLYVLAVSPINDENNLFYVTAEKSGMQDVIPGGGSHFLCCFEGGTHSNFGSSDEWADVERFEARALELAAERLGFPIESVRRFEPQDLQEPESDSPRRLDS